MSGQIQYNYYNTVATKIEENTFIFRGKQNSPNLVLPNSVSYVSTKLTIRPSEGLIDIEHESIATYSKRVIVTFPLKLEDDTAIGATKEINLNAVISKSIQFDMNDTGSVIRLDPSIGEKSVEGFCSAKDKRKMLAKIDGLISDKVLAHQSGYPHGAVGSLSDAELKYLASKIGPMMSGGQVIDSANGDWECTPFDDSTDTSKSYVAVGLSAVETDKEAENSLYRQAAINVIAFLFIMFVGLIVVRFIYKWIALKLTGTKLHGLEFLVILVVIIITVIILATMQNYDPIKATNGTTSQKKQQNDIKESNKNKLIAGSALMIILFIVMGLVHEARRAEFDADPLGFDGTYGSRTFMGYFTHGFFGMKDLYNFMKSTNWI